MKVLFATNIPSPYRVDFFNELGKYCDLTVCYERKTSSERDKSWKGDSAKNFHEVYLDLRPVGTDRSKGHALKEFIKTHKADVLILSNYVSPATMEAIAYCRFHRISYYIEYDGGFNKKDQFIKYILKRFLLGGAKGHLTTADEHKKYLLNLGIQEEKIFKYPFTSIKEEDIREFGMLPIEIKEFYRKKIGIAEHKVILSVGRFSYENGYGEGHDVLLKACKELDKETGIYIVGDEPTEEFVKLREVYNLLNVHYVGFKNKEELAEYYAAADLFILLSRGDVWGLVINEAMMFGLPIITTPYCIARTELVRENENGFLVDLDDINYIAEKIKYILIQESVQKSFSEKSFEMIQNYTIEDMDSIQTKQIWEGGIEPRRGSFKKYLGISENTMILAVGQFIYRKGFDLLIQAMSEMDSGVGVYIIGGKPTREYIDMKKKMQLDNLHFEGFKSKLDLYKWYQAADVLVMPTREDIWGLVVNEAMAVGVPVISSDKCIAALEMVVPNTNGHIFKNEDINQMVSQINELIENKQQRVLFGKHALACAHQYTIEKMAQRHIEIFEDIL